MNYAYMNAAGVVIWRDLPLSKRRPPVEVLHEGDTFRRSFQAERAGVPATKGWPIECYASGVNANQAQDLRDEFKRMGVSVEVTNDGDPIYTDPAHRRKALAARGFHDRKAFY